MYTGLFPIAPATFASLVFAAIYWFVPGGEWLCKWPVVLVTAIVSVPVSTAMEKDHGPDPSRVVIDEVLGMQIVLGAAAPTLWGVLAAFFVFRVFDILKPWPAGRMQKLPRGWGVVLDDVVAGIQSRIVMLAATYWLPQLGTFAW